MGLGGVLTNGTDVSGMAVPGTVINALSFLVDNRGLTTMAQTTTLNNKAQLQLSMILLSKTHPKPSATAGLFYDI